MNKCTFKIILRKDLISKKTGMAPLSMMARINGKKTVIALNQFVLPADWDEKRETVNTKGNVYSDLSLTISKAKSKAVEIFTEYRLLNAFLTVEKFRELYLEENSRTDFLVFYQHEMEERRLSGRIEHSTFKSHRNTLIKLRLFSKGKPILFSEFNKKWVLKFDSWHLGYLRAKSEKLGKPQINNSLNTRHIALKNIKTYLNIAASDEAIRFTHPFSEGMPVKGVNGSREFLSPDELRKLIELYFSGNLGQVQKGVLARFLCSCFTSIRISDHMRLDLEYVEKDALIFKPKKTLRTQKSIRIPLNDVSRYFIKEITEKDFIQISDQKTNMNLKGIAAAAGIKKNVTSHVGRHTFATTFLMLGGQVHVLQQIMGHADIKTTMAYVHLIDDHLTSQMQVMNQVASDLIPKIS